METGIIYRATNLVNGKVYVGQTVQPFEKRIAEHFRRSAASQPKGYFHRALKLSGKEAFTWEVITHCPLNELDAHERFYISVFSSHASRKGYNLELGGSRRGACRGFVRSPETCAKLSRALMGHHVTKEAIAKRVEKMRGRKSEKAKAVKCIETGEVFRSITEAATRMNISGGNISQILSGKRKQSRGLSFAYATGV